MEGPTPVSALIHAATMVTAGVFLLIKLSILFTMFSSYWLISSCILSIGCVTCFFAASSGLVQYEFKKVIAYSTCSQLGYMVVAIGLHQYSLSLFHLFNHAFLKPYYF
jgi:NADH:ubiquinone oxidoreductase subunit 5 (subunit L)/multisubunit Na+/H+ antiporter MnhA subunit